MLSRLRGLVRNRPQMPTSGQTLLWDDLHDYALLQILDHLAITELVRLEGVNRRLHHLVRRILNGRQHLLLIIGRKSWRYEQYKKNVIILSSWSVDTVEQILRLLPNLTFLWFVITIEINDLQPLTLLLDRLSTQLTALRLNFREAQLSPNLFLSPLFPIINRMVHLRTLICHLARLFTPEEAAQTPHLHLPVLRHLRSFFCTTVYNGDAILAEVLNQMAVATETLPLVYLNLLLHAQHSLPRLLSTAPQIAQRFRLLDLHTLVPLTTAQLNLICERFRQLNSLSIGSPYLTTRQMASAIAKLPRLTSLTWFAHFHIRQIYRTDPRYLDRFADAIESDEVAEVEEALPQLTTVGNLDLILDIVRHEDLALLHLERLFPSVTSLDIWIASCHECGYQRDDSITTERRKRCLLKTATYWRGLPQLRKVTSQKIDITEAEWRSMEGVLSGGSNGWLGDSRLCKAFKGIYKKLANWIGGCCDGRRH